MAIDFVVDYDCVPKQTIDTAGILARLKGRARAGTIIKMFRANGDQRPPSEMGFEFTRTTLEGIEERQVIIVQDLLDQAATLDPLAHHCVGCPANALGGPFGCFGAIQYPFSKEGELWLLKQLPTPEEPMPWLLLRQTTREMGYTGQSVVPLRSGGTYFEDLNMYARGLGEMQVSTNQTFEMLFMLGHIQPAQAGALLLFFNAIANNLEADKITVILGRSHSTEDLQERFPFHMQPADDDDTTITELKQFFYALYLAWSHDVRLLLDV